MIPFLAWQLGVALIRRLTSGRIEAKAPLFSHFIESLSGLETIRAFGWTPSYLAKTNGLIDASQRPYYLLLCVQRWLVCVLDLVVAGLTVLLAGLAVALRNRIDADLLGVALVMMMDLGQTLADFVQFWTQLETSLGAVARIKRFHDDTPSELSPGVAAGSPPPAELWPAEGAVRFDNVSLTYK